ncbi:hypothetical protein MMC20_003438 [Loxospora ochrophaea]|nr:hypothetical protein [Loxospora ochrophaea]
MASCASGTAPLDAQDDDIQILSFRPVSKNMAQPKAKTQARLNEALANMMRMSANAKPKMGIHAFDDPRENNKPQTTPLNRTTDEIDQASAGYESSDSTISNLSQPGARSTEPSTSPDIVRSAPLRNPFVTNRGPSIGLFPVPLVNQKTAITHEATRGPSPAALNKGQSQKAVNEAPSRTPTAAAYNEATQQNPSRNRALYAVPQYDPSKDPGSPNITADSSPCPIPRLPDLDSRSASPAKKRQKRNETEWKPRMYADFAESCRSNFPMGEFNQKWGTTYLEVENVFSALVRLPVLAHIDQVMALAKGREQHMRDLFEEGKKRAAAEAQQPAKKRRYNEF